MFLKDLLRNNLALATGRKSEKILSEESIRLMLHVHREYLVNPKFVTEKSVPNLLKKIAKEKQSIHYQLFVETGERSPRYQGVPAAIHYSAMDVFCDSEGKIIAFIADHYRGRNFSSYVSDYDSPDLDHVRFIVAGGRTYQTDERSCPIFTLQHLLSTAYDTALHAQLKVIAEKSTAKMTELSWFDLAPKYNVHTQHFDQFLQYVDHVKTREGRAPHEASLALSDPMLETYLSDERFEQAHSRNRGVPLILNKNIDDLSAEYANRVRMFLTSSDVSESDLVDICYRERYGFVADIMQSALSVSESINREHEQLHSELNKHTLFALLFSNQPLFNHLAASGSKTSACLYALMNNQTFIWLVQSGYISPDKFWETITDTSDGRTCELLKAKVKIIHDCLDIIRLIPQKLIQHPEFIVHQDELLDVIFSKNIKNLFKFKSVREAYFSGELNLSDFINIRYDRIRKFPLDDMSKEQFQHAFAQASPLSVSVGCLSPAQMIGRAVSDSPLMFFKPMSTDCRNRRSQDDLSQAGTSNMHEGACTHEL